MPTLPRIWVYAELDDRGVPTTETAEACRVADWLADRLDARVGIWVFQAPGNPGARPAIHTAAPSTVFAVEDPAMGDFEPRSRAVALVEACAGEAPFVVLFPASPEAHDVAATLAALLGTGLVSHCLELVFDAQGTLEMMVPAFGGLAAITCPEARPILVSLSGGAPDRMGLAPVGDGTSVEVVPVALSEAARRVAEAGPRPVAGPGAEEAGGSPGTPGGPSPGGVALATARVVVGVGAGAVNDELWPLVGRVAEALGAAIGATRPVVDKGRAPEELMIGQSGVKVSPELYLALGVSGDLQHTVGVEGAKTVVAVNHDAAAPIFARAHYGIVGKLETILPLLVEEIEKARRG